MNIFRIFKDVSNHFSYDWKHRKGLFFAEMYSSMVPVVGALILASMQETAPFLYVYLLFISGSLIGIVVGNIRQSGWWVLMNVMFTCINIYGIMVSIN